MEDDELQLLLGMQFEGIEQAKEYAGAIREVGRVENMLARAAERVNASLKETKALMQGLTTPQFVVNNFGTAPNARRQASPEAAPAGAPATQPAQSQAPRIAGPNARYERAFAAYEWARKEGTGAQREDANLELIKAVRALDTAKRAAMTPEMQALYSTRLNLPGGAAPLLGKSLEAAIGKDATRGVLAGLVPVLKAFTPFATALGVTTVALQAMHDAAQESARITNQLTAGQATSGGSVADVARLGLMGGSPDAARAAQERITTDPQAMSAAARLGVVNQRGQYGNLDWTKQYLMLIERTAAIADESQRRRLALTLGIEQEVARYSLLSEDMRKAMKHAADITGRINDPQAQKLAAEFDTAAQLRNVAMENLKSAWGQLFSEDVTGLIEEVAEMGNSLSVWLKGLRGSRKRYETFLGALTGGLLGDRGTDMPTAGASKSGPMMANTQQLMENTQALARLNGTIGGGQMSREAMPSALRGQLLHDALVSRSLQLGSLG